MAQKGAKRSDDTKMRKRKTRLKQQSVRERVAELVYREFALGRKLITYGTDEMAQSQHLPCSMGKFCCNIFSCNIYYLYHTPTAVFFFFNYKLSKLYK